MLMETENQTVSLSIREQNSNRIKDDIVRRAAVIITEGCIVFMDDSSIVMQMVRFLHDKQNLTVITNSLKTATQLCEKRSATTAPAA